MNMHVDESAAHAVYAPSSAHRWTVCTASAFAISQLPEQEEGEAAAEGTAAHDEIERCMRGEMDDPAWLDVDPEHPAAYGVALVMDYVRKLPPGKLWIEQRVRLTDQIWGRCDVAHWEESTGILTIVDYKNGNLDVDAVENEQLRIYAAASIYTHKLPVKWIRYAVVQPNSFIPGPRVKQWGEGPDTLFAFAEKTAAIPYLLPAPPSSGMESKNTSGPPLDPSKYLTFVGVGAHCRDCPLFGRCEPSKDVLMHLSTMLATPAEQVQDGQVAAFLAAKKPLEHFYEALLKAKTAKAVATAPPKGTKLVLPATKRAWLNEESARTKIFAEKGIEGLAPPSPAAAEKMGVDITGMAESPKAPPVLALESDRRTAWRGSAAEMFKGVTG